MDRIEIVQAIIDKIKGKTYLEIGVQAGESFFPVNSKTKIGVDPKFVINLSWAQKVKRKISNILKLQKEMLFEMTSDDFFYNKSSVFNKNKIDVALVDGLHTHQQSLKDVLNCLKYMNDKGVIVMHDCSPLSEAMAYPAQSIDDAKKLNLPGWDGRWNGDVWKTIIYLRSFMRDLNVFVLDCDFGIGIVAKGKPENVLNYSVKDIEQMSYRDLDSRRSQMLNLKKPESLYEFLKNL